MPFCKEFPLSFATLLGGDFWSSSQCLSHQCSEARGGGGFAEGQHVLFEGNVAVFVFKDPTKFSSERDGPSLNPPSLV